MPDTIETSDNAAADNDLITSAPTDEPSVQDVTSSDQVLDEVDQDLADLDALLNEVAGSDDADTIPAGTTLLGRDAPLLKPTGGGKPSAPAAEGTASPRPDLEKPSDDEESESSGETASASALSIATITTAASYLLVNLSVGLVLLLDKPFDRISPQTKRALSPVAIGTCLVAIVVWVLTICLETEIIVS